MTVLELQDVRRTYPGEPPVESVRGVSLVVRRGRRISRRVLNRPNRAPTGTSRASTTAPGISRVPMSPRDELSGRSPERTDLRAHPDRVGDVHSRLAGSANPVDPSLVEVSRPSDALSAKIAAKEAGASLVLGLGAIALLVGAIGIANVMVVSVLERRTEIGLRRALGAARSHVAAQFLIESLVLSVLGGAAGLGIGLGITAVMAYDRGWEILVPPQALWGGMAVAIASGALAGLYPALRAARVPPTDALRTT